MNKDTLRQIAVSVATVATIVMNILANALPLNGLNTGEISDRFDVYFVPAGYVFSIWGLIYLALIAYTVYQALPANRERPALRRIGWPYVLSCAANITWLFMWHYERFNLSLAAMLVLLAALIAIYLLLGIGRAQVSMAMRWAVHIPFSIYLGWITVATVANATNVLYLINWDGLGLGPVAWAVIMLIVATAIAVAVNLTRRDVAYVLVVIWAFVGISVKHADTGVVSVAAGVLALLMAASLFWSVPRDRVSGPMEPTV